MRRRLSQSKTVVENHETTESAIMQLPDSVKSKLGHSERRENLYLSLIGIGFEKAFALEACLHCQTFAEAISYKNKDLANKSSSNLTRNKFRGKRMNTSKSVQKIRKLRSMLTTNDMNKVQAHSKSHGLLKLSAHTTSKTKSFRKGETAQSTRSTSTQLPFVSVEEGMELESDYVTGVYKLDNGEESGEFEALGIQFYDSDGNDEKVNVLAFGSPAIESSIALPMTRRTSILSLEE